jgi:peptidyl-prolyl cis-trans isomerase A (cyclophilin A)/peptidyl-prolyl cis-trans isomerase B (cyclophilin B)
MRSTIFMLAAVLSLTNGAFAQDQTPAPDSGAAAAAPAQAAPPPDNAVPAPPPGPGPIDPSIPEMTGPQILISTSMGDITLQLDAVRAPKSVEHVLTYVKARHYDGTVFYRVIPGALIQMGSWDAKGLGRPDIIGIKRVPLEVKNGLSNVRGSVGLARGEEPDSAGADFFINVGDESPLDAAKDVPGNTTGYAVFGKVIGGLSVVDAISKVKTGGLGPMEGQAPLVPILISKVTIVPGTYIAPPPAPFVKPPPSPQKKKK